MAISDITSRKLDTPGVIEVIVGGEQSTQAPRIIIENAGGLAVMGAGVYHDSEGAIGITSATLTRITQQIPASAIVWFHPGVSEVNTSPVLKFPNSGLLLDSNECVVRSDGTDVELTNMEYRLAEFLMRREGIFQTYHDIHLGVWGDNIGRSIGSVRVHIKRIREKLEDRSWSVHSKRSRGYMFSDNLDE